MKTKTIFTGAATALITPLNENGIDYEKFGALVEWQIASGIDALVVCGTTGESPALDDKEHLDAIKFVVDKTAGRVPVIAGTGSNDTAYAIHLTQEAEAMGADAALLVTPYYNKATQRGLVKMYSAIAESTNLPMILYNVPSRTGVGIEPATYAELADVKNITAIKEANGNISKIVETMALVKDKLDLYSGNDDQIVPLMSLGAKGVISVLSNPMPTQTHELCAKCLAGDFAGASKMQYNLLPFINALFSEVNPIPVKSAMAKMGFCENYLRLPLCEMDSVKEAKMFDIMKGLGLI